MNDLTEVVIGGAIEVHRTLGPGLLESAYQACLTHELRQRGLIVRREVMVPVVYKGLRLDCSYRIDLLINEALIVEAKSVERFDDIHVAQVLTYLKLTGLPLGLLINFNSKLLKHGIRRIILSAPSAPLR